MAGSKRLLCLSSILTITVSGLSFISGYAQTPDTKTKATASVAGRVTIGDKPAAGIIVAINGMNQQTLVAQTTTDAEGKYRIGGLAPGQVTIGTFAPTYVPPASPTFVQGRVLNLSADDVIEGMDFKLTRGGVITGRVTEGEGRPVVEERISLNQIDDGRGPTQAIPGRAMVTRGANPFMYSTDDRGIYRIYGLPAGRYLVSVGDDAGGTGTVRGAGYYQRTYAPDTTDASKASIVEVSEGGEAKNIDINVGLRARTYTVRGRIIDADTNQPIAGVNYSFGPLRQNQNQTFMSGMYSAGTPTNANGEFRIEGIEPGRYAVMVMSNSFAPVTNQQPRVYSDPIQFEITDSDVADLEVKAHQGLSVSGAVITEGTSDKRALAALSKLFVVGFVEPSSTGIQTYLGNTSSPIAADGSFQLDGLRAGKVSLNIAGNASGEARNFTVSRVVYERELPNRQIELVAGQNVSGVRIYLAYGSAIIKGEVKVEGGTLPADAMMFVALMRENQLASGPITSAQIDARGRFIINGVPAGTYDAVLQIISFGQTNLPRGLQRTQRQQVAVSDDSELQISFTIDLTPKEGP
jgi:protocatechuate 3,4-dioxygenase beta subunit